MQVFIAGPRVESLVESVAGLKYIEFVCIAEMLPVIERGGSLVDDFSRIADGGYLYIHTTPQYYI